MISLSPRGCAAGGSPRVNPLDSVDGIVISSALIRRLSDISGAGDYGVSEANCAVHMSGLT